MRQLFVATLAFGLAGCLDDQKQRLAQCQIDALRISPNRASQEHDQFMRLCMRAGGYDYEASSPRCQAGIDWYASITGRAPTQEGMASPLKLHCYRPMSWIGRAIYPIEARLDKSE